MDQHCKNKELAMVIEAKDCHRNDVQTRFKVLDPSKYKENQKKK